LGFPVLPDVFKIIKGALGDKASQSDIGISSATKSTNLCQLSGILEELLPESAQINYKLDLRSGFSIKVMTFSIIN